MATTNSKKQYVSSLSNSATSPVTPKSEYVSNAVDQNYFLRPNETIDAYNSRISDYRGASPTTPTSTSRNNTQEMPSSYYRPTQDYYSGARSAMDQYIQSLMPSERESGLQKSLDNLSASTMSGMKRQEEDAIPMNFITGRQRVIENRGREMMMPLEQQLGRMQSDRQAMSEAQKARYDFETSLAGAMREDDRYMDEAMRAERAAQTEGDRWTSEFGLKQRQQEIDEAYNSGRLSLDQARFEHDKALEWFNAQTSRMGKEGGGGDELLTIAEAKSLGVPYGTTRSQAIGKRSLTASQQESAVSAGSALGALNNLQNEIRNEEGGYDSLKLFNLGLGKLGTYEREIKDVITRIRTGAALSSSEESFYGKQVPKPYDNDETIKAKINQLSAFYAGIAGTPVTLQMPDGSYVTADDMYDPETRLEVRNAISSGANVIQY